MAKYPLSVLEAAKPSSKQDCRYWRTYCTPNDSGTTSIPVHQEQNNRQRNCYAAVVTSALVLCMVFITHSCNPNMHHWCHSVAKPQTEVVRPRMPKSSPDMRQQIRSQGKLLRCPRQQEHDKAEPGAAGPVWGHQKQTMLCYPGPVQHSLDQGKRGECPIVSQSIQAQRPWWLRHGVQQVSVCIVQKGKQVHLHPTELVP